MPRGLKLYCLLVRQQCLIPQGCFQPRHVGYPVRIVGALLGTPRLNLPPADQLNNWLFTVDLRLHIFLLSQSEFISQEKRLVLISFLFKP